MISAMTAHNIYETAKANKRLAWLQLEEAITKAAENGECMVVFKTTPGMNFPEHRKDVKKKLEDLGYEVAYRHYEEDRGWISGDIYTISWH